MMPSLPPIRAPLCRRLRGTASRLLIAGGLAAAPAAAASPVSVELVLAIDVSLSVNDLEYRQQMDGIAAAFQDPDVGALIAGHQQGVAVLITQWSGTRNAAVPLGWTVLRDAGAARAYAARVAAVPRPATGNFTAIGHAMAFAIAQIEANPYVAEQRIIDISGDGRSNSGPKPEAVRGEARVKGITVNGLAIVNAEPGLTAYYAQSVIAGPQSFVVSAQDFGDFAEAFDRKLKRELSPRIAGQRHPGRLAWGLR